MGVWGVGVGVESTNPFQNVNGGSVEFENGWVIPSHTLMFRW